MYCTFHVWLKIVLYFCTILENTNKLITLLNKAISTVQTVLKDKPHQLHTVTAILTTRYYISQYTLLYCYITFYRLLVLQESNDTVKYIYCIIL